MGFGADEAAPDGGDEIEAMVHEAHRRPGYPIFGPALLWHRSFHFLSRDSVAKAIAQVRETLGRETLAANANRKLLHSMLWDIPEAALPALRGWRVRLQMEVHAEYVSATFICDCPAAADEPGELRKAIDKIVHADCPVDMAQDCVDRFFTHVWRDVGQRIAIPALGETGRLFADFRGLAVVPAPVAPLAFGENEVLIPDGDTTRERRARQIDPKLREYAASRRNFLAAVLGLASGDGRAKRHGANVVMCGMLDGAAIYASSLGWDNAAGVQPQRYFVAYNGFAGNQLGRFIRRLHVQGEVRLAGLFDLEKLRDASDEVRDVGKRLDEYVTGAAGEPDSGRRLARLTRRWSAIGSDCQGGLIYRVSQSRHYIQAFRERMDDLRTVRIEGWQPYDAFVRRNLFKSYDFISRIGDRYDALGQRLEKLSAAAQTANLERNTREVTKLLRVAEFVGWAAFSYYAGSMIGGIAYWVLTQKIVLQLLARHGMVVPPLPKDFYEVTGWLLAALTYVQLRKIYIRIIDAQRDTLRRRHLRSDLEVD